MKATSDLYDCIEENIKKCVEKPTGLASMTVEEMDRNLEKGYMDIQAGNVKPARQAFADIRRNYSL